MAALMFWASFLWANFQLLPYISILPLSSEKFSNASKFLTSTVNISFIHWLLTSFQSSDVEAELFATSYHKYQCSEVLPVLLFQGFPISTCPQCRHYRPPGHQSPSPGISDTWTTFIFHYKSCCYVRWFQHPQGWFFPKLFTWSPHCKDLHFC